MLGIASALPFLGFGFLDNFLMIIFGEMIDSTICIAFSASTMAAAAIGNTISDAAGIFSGGAVEEIARKYGYEEPEMESEQKQLFITRVWRRAGQVIGIIVGCALGCCPLLFTDPHEAERLRKEKDTNEVLESVVAKMRDMLDAEALALMFFDENGEFLVSKQHSPNLPAGFRWRAGIGFIGHVANTGNFVNIADVTDEPLYAPCLHDNLCNSGIKVRNILCMPIFRGTRVQGVFFALNKLGEPCFTSRDEDILAAVCSHVSVATCDTKTDFEEILETCQLSMQKSQSPDWGSSAAAQRMNAMYHPVLEGIRRVVGADAVALMIFNAAIQELHTAVIDGPLPKHKVAITHGITGEAMRNGQTISTCSQDPDWDHGRHKNYMDTGMDVHSELVVPIMDSARKCIACIKCVNKHHQATFQEEDIKYVQEMADEIGLVLEGPDAGLRRALVLTRRKMQQEDVLLPSEVTHSAVNCFLEYAEHLPLAADRDVIDPYITIAVAKGDPLKNSKADMRSKVMRQRAKDRKAIVRRFAKSNTILKDANPHWSEAFAVALPGRLDGEPLEELFVHVLLWHYSPLGEDRLVAQASLPMRELSTEELKAFRLRLEPIPGQEDVYDLSAAVVHARFKRQAA